MGIERERRSGTSEALESGESRAPGKRTRSATLPVQRRASSTAETTPQPLPTLPPRSGAEEAGDPFGIHLLGTPVQRRGGDDATPADVHAAAGRGLEGPATTLPFLDQIQASFGAEHGVSGVQAHVGGAATEAAAAMGASAYATGNHVAFAGAPDLHTAAHEAAHVVQQRRGVSLYGDVGAVGDAYERQADAAADRVVAGESAADLLDGAQASGGAHAVQRHESDQKDYGGGRTDKAESARFEGDKDLEEIHAGTRTVGKGGRGLTVTKLQQALIDLGYLLPKYGVDGKFEGETRAALCKFQRDVGLTETGEFDEDTSTALHAKYDGRQPYIDRAKHDPANPGTRDLSADDKKAALDAMVPAVGAGGAPAVFTEEVSGKKYGDRIRDHLAATIASFHKELYEDKVGLRADPAKNFHDWSTLEGPAAAAKQVTDTVYDSNYGGAAAFPAMTHAGGNLIDQWEDELALNAGKTPAQKKAKAADKVWYLINSNCETINTEHGAVPSAAAETAILSPIVESFVATDAKVQTMLDLDIGWEGAQLDGTVYLQRYKSTNPDKDKAKETDRVQMWSLFHTCIHEYIHTLAHPDYQTWAQTFDDAGDSTRYNTLIEGFCDFFTLNVRSTLAPDAALISKIEGPYANGNPIPAVDSGVYPSHAQAEQVVSIVGIKNAQAAYFRGETSRMGDA